MTTPTVTELVRNGNRRGQRVNGVVRFLPDDLVVLGLGRAVSKDSSCRCRSRASG